MDRTPKKDPHTEINICYLENPQKAIKNIGPKNLYQFDVIYSIMPIKSGGTQVVVYHIKQIGSFYMVLIQSMTPESFADSMKHLMNHLKEDNKNK